MRLPSAAGLSSGGRLELVESRRNAERHEGPGGRRQFRRMPSALRLARGWRRR
ncbi:MAG: hypothetical protein QM844_07650 [Planctomycetota bacterium]|jgi:hypothetical protein|nr:hypothetical protein [Planctomycetota bacterium]